MTRLLDLSAASKNRPAPKERSFRNALACQGPRISYPRSISNKMAIFGMAIGYLGLVAILASAPIWNQAWSSYQAPFPTCTDFGGSR